MSETPSLYEMDPAIYDTYIDTPMERRNFDAVFKRMQPLMGKRTRILDMCCGTGSFPRRWLVGQGGITYVGVDINEAFLAYARKHLDDPHYPFVHGDAVDADFGRGAFDVVLMTSAYHHIEDGKKRPFLFNARRQMKESGRGIAYEKFVAPFDTAAQAAEGAVRLYSERTLDMLKEGQLNNEQLFALCNEMYLTAIRQGEYKVSFRQFVQDALAVGLMVRDPERLWPNDERFGDPSVGDFVATLTWR